MSGSISELVCATAARTSFAKSYVAQRARTLQSAGLLPIASGRQSIAATPRDLTHLLISLAAEKARIAPIKVHEYTALAKLVDDKERAGDSIEQLIKTIWSGDRQARGTTISIVETDPKIIITKGGYEDHFYPAGELIDIRGLLSVQRTLEIPGIVVAQIGFDLGFARCRDAV